MPKPPRSAGGHRLYSSDHKKRLIFIRRARELAFPVKQVRVLLELADDRSAACGRVKRITEQHIAEIRRKVKALEHLEGVLTRVTAQCRGDQTNNCAILDALADQDKDICAASAGS